jgi:hypothetical protein
VDLDHLTVDPLVGGTVETTVVRLDETRQAVRPRVADAPEVDELVALDGLPTALVLPVAHLDDDVHPGNLCASTSHFHDQHALMAR